MAEYQATGVRPLVANFKSCVKVNGDTKYTTMSATDTNTTHMTIANSPLAEQNIAYRFAGTAVTR